MWLYLELGVRHIADLAGYDHILFVAALAIGYRPSEWKRLILLVTAFTIGHSISLAAATLGALPIRPELIEVLIPVTILVAAVQSIIDQHASPQAHRSSRVRPQHRSGVSRYVLTLLFGLIHGVGFSTYLRSLLGESQGIVQPLLAFNLGLEIGQLLILAMVLLLGAIAIRAFFTERDWVHFVSGSTVGVATLLLIERLRALV